MEPVTIAGGKETRYYHALNRACDFIVRCKDCKALITLAFIHQVGTCECGNKRFTEIVTLSDDEIARVRTMDFPYRDQFLAEFSPLG